MGGPNNEIGLNILGMFVMMFLHSMWFQSIEKVLKIEYLIQNIF